MKTFEEIQEEANALAEELLSEARLFVPSACGLDVRAAGSLYVGDGFIAATLADDRTLQYYGGFEYVDKSLRLELGGHVFYSGEDDRVRECLERALEGPDDDEEPEPCGQCCGTGEGMHDGTHCGYCHGSGVRRRRDDE